MNRNLKSVRVGRRKEGGGGREDDRKGYKAERGNFLKWLSVNSKGLCQWEVLLFGVK